MCHIACVAIDLGDKTAHIDVKKLVYTVLNGDMTHLKLQKLEQLIVNNTLTKPFGSSYHFHIAVNWL